MDDPRDLGFLTDDKAALLLDRAAKLDAQGGRVSIAELRHVAMEAGISADAFERALAEISSPRGESGPPAPLGTDSSHRTAPWYSRLTTPIQRTGIFLTGSALAFLSQTFISDVGMDSEPVMIFTLAVAGLMVAWAAVTKRQNRKLLDFEVDLGVLWTAMTFWIMVLNPEEVGAVLEVMMPAGFLASLVGGLIVGTGPSGDEPEQLELPERT